MENYHEIQNTDMQLEVIIPKVFINIDKNGKKIKINGKQLIHETIH